MRLPNCCDCTASRLNTEQLDEILIQTEGWAAGLRFVASTIDSRKRHNGHTIPPTVQIDAYLAEEIFERHDPDTRSFLLATSICDHLTVDLARTLSGHDDADSRPRTAPLRQHVDRATSTPCRRPTASMLCCATSFAAGSGRATPTGGVGCRVWRRTGSRRNGAPLQALDHAVNSDDEARIEHLMSTYAFELIAHGEGPKLRAADRCDFDRALRRPFTALTAASAFLDIGDSAKADLLLAGFDLPDTPTDAFLDARSNGGLAARLASAVTSLRLSAARCQQ